ncbi:MAG: OadG family protein [Piscirickettsiaceae bacterium]|nr:OadG family protein [Piscirickettsiaceae bacterium]
MNEFDLLSEGVTLMAFGISFVFVFLTLLVIVTSMMSWIIIKYEARIDSLEKDDAPTPLEIDQHKNKDDRTKNASDTNNYLIGILSAAIHKYRRSHDKNKHIS